MAVVVAQPELDAEAVARTGQQLGDVVGMAVRGRAKIGK